MHTLVRQFIKTAIGFLAAGLAIGGWMVARRELFDRFPTTYVMSAHTHAIFVGFVMMMIMGVALWLFPRPERQDERYRPGVVMTSYWLITIGTAGRVIGELLRPTTSAFWLRMVVVSFSVAQIAGHSSFLLHDVVAHPTAGEPLTRREGRALLTIVIGHGQQ